MVTFTGITPTSGQNNIQLTLSGTGFSSLNLTGYNNSPTYPTMVVVIAWAGQFNTGDTNGYYWFPNSLTYNTPNTPNPHLYTIVNDTTITLTLDPGLLPVAGPYTVLMELYENNVPGSGSTNLGPFTYTVSGTGGGGSSCPDIVGLTVNSGPSTGGNGTIISGTGFTGTTQVDFGAFSLFSFQVPLRFTVDSDSQITVSSVPAATPGVVDVVVHATCGVSSPNQYTKYTYQDPPTITALNPPGGPKAGGNQVGITGTNFTNASQVLFGATPAQGFTVMSDVYIIATAPPHPYAEVVTVFVYTPYGQSVSGSAAFYDYGLALPGVDIWRKPVSSMYGMYIEDMGEWSRIATGLSLTGVDSFTDYTAALHVTYEYKAITTNEEHISTESNHEQTLLDNDYLWLHNVADPAGTLHAYLFTPAERSDEFTPEYVLMDFAGREKPVAEFGIMTGRKVKIALRMRQQDGDYQALYKMVKIQGSLCYRDSRGRRAFGIIIQIPEQDELQIYDMTLELNETDYTDTV